MTAINLFEFKALVSLLDDDDNEVFTHVSNKLVSFGKEGLSLLESAWEAEENIVIQEKLESLIKKIQYDNIKDRLKQWLESDEQDLLEAALIVNTIEYPEIDELAIIDKINSIAKSVWIELNAALSPLEELQVMNQVFYQLHGFFSNNDKNTFKQIPDLGNLNKILETKNGNSISLGILFLIIAQKNDLPIYGVNLPYHFIMCYARKHLSKEILDENTDEKQVMFYINPINKGIAFSRMEITNYLKQIKLTSKKNYYSPCNNKAIIKALIFNQIAYYDKESDKAKFLKELFFMIKSPIA